MNGHPFVFALLLVSVVLPACSEAAPADAVDGPPVVVAEVDLEPVYDQLTERYCDVLPNCADLQGMWRRTYMPTVADCRARIHDLLDEPLLSIPTQAATSQAVHFNAAALDACIQRFNKHIVCASNVSLGQLCPDVFEGTLEVGSACMTDLECKPGLFCEQVEGACPGVCAAKVVPGEDCDRAAQCLAPTGGYGACIRVAPVGSSNHDRICIGVAPASPVAGEGDACGATGTEPNHGQGECGPGLVCHIGVSGRAGTCMTPVAQGEPCETNQQPCDIGVCLFDEATGGTTCQHRPMVQEGEVCFTEADGFIGNCDPLDRLDCVMQTGVCTQLGDGTRGAPCRDLHQDYGCEEGLYCSYEAQPAAACSAKKPAGELCGQAEECESNKCAGGDGSPGTRVCVARNACGV